MAIIIAITEWKNPFFYQTVVFEIPLPIYWIVELVFLSQVAGIAMQLSGVEKNYFSFPSQVAVTAM